MSRPRPWLDWRRIVIYTHRWLGLAGCLIFIVWFQSGIVMVYARMPRLTAEERLARLPLLDLSPIRVPPADVAQRLGVVPERFRIGTLGSRPVYQFLSAGSWSVGFADTGAPLSGVTAEESMDLVRRFMPEYASTLRYDAHLAWRGQRA